MSIFSDPLQRTALGAFIGLGTAALLTESSDPPLSDYLSVPATYLSLTGTFAIAAYFAGRPTLVRPSMELSGPEAFKAPSDGNVIALTGKDLEYRDVVCDTFEREERKHQPMRAITMVAGLVGAAAAIGAMRKRPDFRLEGVVLAGLGGLIGIYNGYCLVHTHQQMQRRFVAQLQIEQS